MQIHDYRENKERSVISFKILLQSNKLHFTDVHLLERNSVKKIDLVQKNFFNKSFC